MSKLKGAALDRAVAHAMGVKSVHDCEKWGEHMNRIEEDDDIQVYKKPWVGLTEEERNTLLHMTITHSAIEFGKAIEAKLKEKNA